MISPHPEPVAYQILPVLSQCMHDGQHLLVVYGIQPLVRKELPALKCYRVTSLHQYCVDPLSQRITLQNKWLREIWQCKQLLDSPLNLIPIGLGVPIGGGNHCLYALLKLDGVLKPPV